MSSPVNAMRSTSDMYLSDACSRIQVVNVGHPQYFTATLTN